MKVKRQRIMHRRIQTKYILANPIIDDRYLNTAKFSKFNNYTSLNILAPKLYKHENEKNHALHK